MAGEPRETIVDSRIWDRKRFSRSDYPAMSVEREKTMMREENKSRSRRQSKQRSSASQGDPQLLQGRWRTMLWVLLSIVLIGAITIILLGVPSLNPFLPTASVTPLPLRATVSPAEQGGRGRIKPLADIALPGGASRFDYQSLDPQTHRLFLAHLGASSVIVFDTTSNRIVATISHIAGVHGVLAIPALGRVYASATDANQVDVIDERTLRVLATIPGGDYPDGLAYDPVEQHLFVSDESGGTDTVIDTRTDRQIATIPLGGEAGNTQYDSVSQRIFVAVQMLNQLVAIDPATDRIIGRYGLPSCEHDHSLLIDAPSRFAFVTCDSNNVLLLIDLRFLTVTSVQTVGDGPDVLAFDRGWNMLYVASESGVLSVFEERGQTIHKVEERFIATEAHSVAVDEATHRLYLPLQNVEGKPVLRIAAFCVPQQVIQDCS
jgi:YVTN family beta-propeller protein